MPSTTSLHVKFFIVVSALGLTLLVGCKTRSISNSESNDSYGWRGSGNPLYRGELSELDILGAAPAVEASEANISKALATSGGNQPMLKRGDKVMLIQSGALMPDSAMIEEASKYFEVAPFSGVPPENKTDLPASLRLRAAQGGYRLLVCYWGVLESAQIDREGKTVSWVPIVGAFVPDQKQQMRIRLKALVLDVATGSWKMLTPEAHADDGFNSRWNRRNIDQRLVEDLKVKGYHSLVSDLMKH